MRGSELGEDGLPEGALPGRLLDQGILYEPWGLSVTGQRHKLLDIARELRQEKESAKHTMEHHYPRKSWLHVSHNQSRKNLLARVEVYTGLLGDVSAEVFKLEQRAWQSAGVSWEELKRTLIEAGVNIPLDQDLPFIDLSNAESMSRRIYRANRGAEDNSFLIIYLDGNVVELGGQSIFLHRPDYHEATFLAIFDELGLEENKIVIESEETVHEKANYVSRSHEISFGWQGWIFLANEETLGDFSIKPHGYRHKDVIKQLKHYRRNKRRRNGRTF